MKHLNNYSVYRHKKEESKSNEDIIFALIISIFLFGLIIFSQPEFVGRVVSDATTETLLINQTINSSTELNLTLRGNVTSLRITGKFVGNGTGKIFVDDVLIVDSFDLDSSGSFITGFVVQDTENISENNVSVEELAIENNENVEEAIEVNDTIVNETILDETINEVIEINESTIVNDTIIENITQEVVENVTINITLEENITLNITENVTVELNETIVNETNITIEINETVEVNDTIEINETIEENITLEVNDTIEVNETIEINETIIENVTQNLTINQTLNLTINETNITINQTLNITQNITSDLEFEFSNYCLDSCYVTLGNNITLRIELNNSEVYIENIVYTIIGEGLEINETNISINVSMNQTNITLNVTYNLTNISEFSINNTLFEIFNKSIVENSLTLFNYTNNTYVVGLDENNYVVFTSYNLTNASINIKDTNDTRISSKIVFIENINETNVVLESNEMDVILKCTQFNETCKQWQETNLSYIYFAGLVNFTVTPGIYATTFITPTRLDYVATGSVYYNSDCGVSCDQSTACNAEGFCVMQHATRYDLTWESQLDFNILNVDDSWYKTEVCSYVYYSNEPVVNYIKYSPESFCSDINNGNSTSSLISYKLVDARKDWVCIDATEIVRYAEDDGYSNVFINWMGQDLQGDNSPFNCYYGLRPLNDCKGYNPSNASDCRPYLKFSYR